MRRTFVISCGVIIGWTSGVSACALLMDCPIKLIGIILSPPTEAISLKVTLSEYWCFSGNTRRSGCCHNYKIFIV